MSSVAWLALRREVPLTVLLLLFLLVLQDAHAQKWKTEHGPCYRDCKADPEPRLCHFIWTEEIYSALSTACGNCSSGVEADCFQEDCVFVDGVDRTVYTLNRVIPGPTINVCYKDIIRVDLTVELLGHAETIHWHGIRQTKTPWFDGVAWVTQCPILYGNTFRYEFEAEDPGTMFYHSHSGLHKVNGIVGAMIVRQSEDDDLHSECYDYDLPEHVILLQDWMHVDAEFVYPGLAKRVRGQPSDSLLINGQGQSIDPTDNTTTKTPLADFEIECGKRYRFRIINAGALSCPIQIQFEGHQMSVIASDSIDTYSQVADSLITFSGERWDVVIKCVDNPNATAFWIYVRTVGFCTNTGASEQVGILRYKNGTKLPPTPRPSIKDNRQLPTGTVVNTPGECESEQNVCASELRAIERPSYSASPYAPPDELVPVNLTFRVATPAELFNGSAFDQFLAFGQIDLVPVLNGISYIEPSAPFLTQPGEEAESCNVQELPVDCTGAGAEDFCVCPHRVIVKWGAVVDIFVVDESDIQPGDDNTKLLAHPMHIHGHSFTCMGQGTLRNITNGKARARAAYQLYASGGLSTYVAHPAIKDVLALPGGGWIWLRFRADNRGAWFFHCHFQYHMAAGMEMVIQVGEDRMMPRPPPGFPRCGNYLPLDSYEDEEIEY